ncbi:MAG: hypothetical protein ACK6BG_12965 [Cyanobacteriota bacterium]
MLLPRLVGMAERDGRRCAPLVLLIGTVLGVGLTRLLQGGLNLSAAQSLRVLVVAMLYLAGPLVVALIAFTRLTPLWLRRARGGGTEAAWLTLGPALLVGPLLLVHGLMGAVLGGVLTGVGGGIEGRLAEAIGAIPPLELIAALIRTALYLSAAGLLCLWEARRLPLNRARAEDLIASLIAREIAMLVGLKLLWTLAVSPIALPTLPG